MTDRHAKRRSLDYCAETCPAVDAALEKVKEAGTYRLREALDRACADLIAAESRIDELEAELADAKDTIADLQSEE